MKRKAEIHKLGISAYQLTQLLSQRILKIFAPCAHLLEASECRSGGGFANGSGCVAYAAIPKLRQLCETPYPTFIPTHFKIFRAVRRNFRGVKMPL